MTIELMRFSKGGSRLTFPCALSGIVVSKNPLPQSCGLAVGQSTPRVSSRVLMAKAKSSRFFESFSTPLYVDDLVEESELVERQTGAPLGARSRLAARVAASTIALSPNGCKGKKSRIARRGKPR